MHSTSATTKDKQHPAKKLRTACDMCHQAKMKCSGGNPCNGCRDSSYDCSYSVSNRIGRPKGTKNKRTLERMAMTSIAVDNDKLNHPISSSASSRESTAPPRGMTFGSGLGKGSAPIERTSFDALLGSPLSLDAPTPFSSSESGSHSFDPFSDNLNSWLNFGDLAASSPFKQQHSSNPMFDASPSFLNEEPRQYLPHDSAYVSPSSVFSDKARASVHSRAPADLSRLVANMDGEIDCNGTITTSNSNSSLSSAATCNCISNHAELLTRLKDLEQRHAQPRLDVVLSGAQQALIPFKEVIDCRICQHDDNQEVLILSAMSIRTLLRSLQALVARYYNSVKANELSDDRKIPRADISEGMSSSMGMHEFPGDERMAVTNLLISRTLDKMKYTLACFKERLDVLQSRRTETRTGAGTPQPRKRSFPVQIEDDVDRLHRGGPGDYDHITRVWQNLDGTVSMLDRVLKSGELNLTPDD